MRFSLLHPSRQRLALAEQAITEWTTKRSGRHEVEHFLSIDTDDDVAGYRVLAARHGVQLVIGPNRSVVDAANRAARLASGDVLIVVSDDFGCPEAWDEALAAVFGDRRDAGALVHDGIEARILTLPILGRALYEQLGYVYYPKYFSLFCDDDLTHTVRGLGKLIDARHLCFPHRHWSVGGHPFDATYARENSKAAYWLGRCQFEKRCAAAFGARPWSLGLSATHLRIDVYCRARMWAARFNDVLRRVRARLARLRSRRTC